jgi:hypothetical protein
LFPRGFGLFEVRLRDRALRDQAARALEREPSEVRRGLGGTQLALLDLVVEEHELVAGRNDRACFEPNRAYDAVSLGADLRALHGRHRADGRHVRLPVLSLHGDRVDALGRGNLRRKCLAYRRELQRLDAGDHANDQHHGDDAGRCCQYRPSVRSLVHSSAPSRVSVTT